ncbi:MAG: sugar phosphate isomerase/epimerase [Clostridiaceae bacterium]|nr:sugar phosphate isomerase/epimerase [Clostridiaceae bacterium]
MAGFALKYSSTAAIRAPGTSPILFKGDLCSSIIKSKNYGFDAVEIHIRRPDEIEIDKINEYCFKNNITISTIGTGMSYVIDRLSLTDLNWQKRKMAIERLKGYIDLAEKLNSGVIIGSMRGKIDFDNYNKHLSVYRENILELTDYAEYKDVPIYLETINRYEVNFHNTIEEMADFLSSINSSRLKILIDTFHMNIEEADMEESIKKYGNYVGHVHFADSNRRYPGKGHISFRGIINALIEIGYEGYIAFEYLPYPDPDTAAKKGLDYLLAIEKSIAAKENLLL